MVAATRKVLAALNDLTDASVGELARTSGVAKTTIYRHFPSKNQLIVTAIDGGTVTLDRPLELDHVPPRADLSVWVANTTRNVVVDSENREVARRGGDRQLFHEVIREHSMGAWAALREGRDNPLVSTLSADDRVLQYASADEAHAAARSIGSPSRL